MSTVVKIALALLVVWVALGVVGAVVRGLFWLTVLAVVLGLATVVWGALSSRSGSPSSR